MKSQETGSFWTLANPIIGFGIALFAGCWAFALLSGAVKRSFGNPEAVATAAPATPATPVPAAPAGDVPVPAAPAPAPDSPTPAAAGTPAAPAQAGDVHEMTMKPAGAAGMEYDIKTFTVKAGQKIKITFENSHPVPQPHNIVFCKPGTKDKVMMAAMQMAASPDGMTKGYIPEGEDIFAHTKLIQPTQTEVLEFSAPAEAGQYPYLCTFPGHGLLMNGVMTVE